MVTTPEEIEPEATRAERARELSEEAVRILIAGSSVGGIRRIVLYAFIAFVIVTLAAGGERGVIAGGFGLVALMLLAMTDRLA